MGQNTRATREPATGAAKSKVARPAKESRPARQKAKSPGRQKKAVRDG